MAEWYVRIVDGEHGPIASATLKTLARSGRITPHSQVRRSDKQTWVEAASLKGLFDPSAEPPTPANAAPMVGREPAGSEPPPLPLESAAWHSLPIVACLVACCFPVGLAAVWTHPFWTLRTKLLWCGGFFAFFLFATVSMRANEAKAKSLLVEAHSKWEQGDRAGAAIDYRKIIEKSLTTIESEDQVTVLQRVIDDEAQKGNKGAVFKFFDLADKLKLIVSPESFEGKNFLVEWDRIHETEKLRVQATNVKVMSQHEMLEFVDNTAKFRGKVLKMKLTYDGKGSLRSGGPAINPFEGIARTKSGEAAFFKIKIRVSPDDPMAQFKSMDEIPNADSRDEIVVTFLCEEGAMFGNRAIRIDRP